MHQIKMTIAFVMLLISSATFAITDLQVFAFAEAKYPALFSGTPISGQYLKYNYRYYPTSKNYLAIDSAGFISILGPFTANVITTVGAVSDFAKDITAWEASSTVSGPCLIDGATSKYPNAKVCFTNLSSPFTCDAPGMKNTADAYLAVAGSPSYTYTSVTACPAGVTTGLQTALTTVLGSSPVNTLAGTAIATSTFAGPDVDGAAAAARFYFAASSTLNGSGITSDGTSLFIVDSGHYSIRKVDIATGTVSTLAGTPAGVAYPYGFPGSGHADGIGTAAAFYQPQGITIDPALKNLYVTDGRYLRKIVIASGQVSTIINFTFTNATTRKTDWFKNPYGIATDGASLYVLDSQLSGTPAILRKIDLATNAVSDVALTGVALLSSTQSVTYSGGNLYVAGGSTVKKIDLATNVVTNLAGDTSVAAISRDGKGTAATFTLQNEGIASDDDNLYINDGSLIRKIALATGVVSTVAGTVSGYGDGIGANVKFKQLGGMVRVGGTLYVTDNLSAVRKIQIK